MKRSSMTETELYRLTPDGWGETCVMFDEAAVCRLTAEAFGITLEECDPDSNPNDRPEWVRLASLGDKNFVILEGFRLSTRKWHEASYREVREMDDVSGLLVGSWETFEAEDSDD